VSGPADDGRDRESGQTPPDAPPWGYYGRPYGYGRRRHGPMHGGPDGFQYRGWHGRHGRERPKWWPANEPWPPQGEFPWRHVRRLFFIRFAIGVFLVFALVIVGPLFAIAQILTTLGLPSPSTGILAAAVMLFLVLAIAGTAGSARRFALPFGDLIEAAGRVEAGEYSARVAPVRRGPRELKSLVAAFNAMATRLEEDEQQRRTLLADVSHELRTPLAVLQGELEAMIDGIHPTDEAHLAAAVDEIRMLTGLVEDLRTLTLAEAGSLVLHPESTDVAVLAQEVAVSFESIASQAGVRLRVEAPQDLPLVELDPLRTRQVLGNLVANALRYSPAGGEVLISATSGADKITLSVVDHGPGVDPQVLPHLFDRFAKSAESRGSGLGLAIARRLVEAHGGSIRAEQPAGGGTAIRFDLPIGPR
jgi:two-component system, OmpR family, sensor histidine kinase BaeS